MAKDTSREARQRRHLRVRAKVKGTASSPRLCVFRSLNHIYAQVIDDERGHTLVAASTLDAEVKDAVAGKKKIATSELVGSLVAKRALGAGIKQVAFDRGGCRYHGRVKALAEAARKAGLKF
ncbi:MAG: 50S ribosomal protein L18 [Chloroflexi bacterium RBG_16_51_9]|nr:MAG: 50S ribosomal protein L18 [Chloroflexi bacterium RBG_16_51_9]